MDYWAALAIVKQVAGELGLPAPPTLVTDEPQVIQLVALLNSAGNELNTYYPWEQFTKQHTFTTSNGVDAYDVPLDWLYYVDQTQWDRTNRGMLIGPKSPQEWNLLKSGGIGAGGGGTRWRVFQKKVQLLPIPGATAATISMEYIKGNWLAKQTLGTEANMVTQDGDTIYYSPWLMVKFIKLKFYELKGFDTTSTKADFMRMFLSLTGTDKGAPILSLVQVPASTLIGPWSVPEGSWPVG